MPREEDLRYQQTRRPTGIIFGFGVLIGVLVGLVIVYQVLSTDVADHLREYATFKAMGYGPGFFLGVVFEEALILGIMGFMPGSDRRHGDPDADGQGHDPAAGHDAVDGASASFWARWSFRPCRGRSRPAALPPPIRPICSEAKRWTAKPIVDAQRPEPLVRHGRGAQAGAVRCRT